VKTLFPSVVLFAPSPRRRRRSCRAFSLRIAIRRRLPSSLREPLSTTGQQSLFLLGIFCFPLRYLFKDGPHNDSLSLLHVLADTGPPHLYLSPAERLLIFHSGVFFRAEPCAFFFWCSTFFAYKVPPPGAFDFSPSPLHIILRLKRFHLALGMRRPQTMLASPLPSLLRKLTFRPFPTRLPRLFRWSFPGPSALPLTNSPCELLIDPRNNL